MDFGTRNPAGTKDPEGQADLVKDGTTASFAKDVLEASKTVLVLVDFWADWCGPCKQLTPLLEKVVKSYKGRVRLVKINVDQNRQIAGKLGIQSLPTVYAFKDGRGLDGFMGAQPESAIKAFIDRVVGDDAAPDLAEALKAADAAMEAGDLQGAAEIYAAVLEEDRQNVQAIAGLARCYMASGDLVRAEQTLELVAPDKRTTSVVAGVRAALDLAKKAGSAGDSSSLEMQVAANPNDHQARFDLAVALAANGDKSGALDHLLDLFKKDKAWNDEAARKQLVQLFEAWGAKDPSTLDGRRRLSSLMFR